MKLSTIAETLEYWIICQGKWMILEPIFSQYEVQRQLTAQVWVLLIK